MTLRNNPQATVQITIQGSSQYNRKTGMNIPGTFTAETKATTPANK